MRNYTLKLIYSKNYHAFRSFCRHKSSEVRVRFAPSPTGYLHLGGLRTALYNFLFAKKYNGKFLLRIEDTDQTRVVQGAIVQLQKDLEWAGIEIDEGPSVGGNFGPYLQSERLKIYRENVNILLENGSAYHCFCTERRLQLLKKEAVRLQEIPKYDNKCRTLTPDTVSERLSKGESSCIRFKINNSEETFEDLIYGTISYDVSLNEGDPVIIKSDGFPTYHFANVVDDHLMRISHVLRGVEWQISTIKHILLYRAFNWTPPIYGHLPLLMNSDGTKLSKRQGDIKINYYKERGIFPLAVINFITHSGGGFSKDSERHLKPSCYSIRELIDQFDISRINTHSGKLMSERLLEFNRYAFRRKLQNKEETMELIERVIQMVKDTYPERVADGSLNLNSAHIMNILNWAIERISTLSDLVADNMSFIWILPSAQKIDNKDCQALNLFRNVFESEVDMEADKINNLCKSFCKENAIKYGGFMKLMRSVLTGLKEGPSVAEIILILGKRSVLNRIEECLNYQSSMR